MSLLDKLNQRHRGRITTSLSELGDSGVATGSRNEARCDYFKELRRRKLMIDLGHDQLAMMIGILTRDRDEFLDDWAKIFCLGLGSRDPFVQNHRNRQLAQERLALRGIAS